MTNMTKEKTKNTNQSRGSSKYIVIRDGHRVSDAEYSSSEDAGTEFHYWRSLTSKWDPSSTVEIVEKNAK